MRFIARCRAFAALLSFVLLIALIATPQLYLLLAWHRLTGNDPSRRRRAVARWQSAYGTRSFDVVAAILGVRVDFRPPAGLRLEDGRPFIVIANHQSSLDILLLFALMARLGRPDLRWIMKRQLFKAPAIGRACRETDCAYVTRGGDPGDRDRVRQCASSAKADQASVIIFPEGTRFIAAQPGSGLTRVLPPKVGGVVTLRRELPDHPVLSVTISWDSDANGKTMFDGASYVGRTVTVESALISDIDDRSVVAWLEDEWRRKDRFLQKTSA